MVDELHEVLLAMPDAPAPARHTAEAPGTNGHAYVALAGSDTYHRADCAMVAAKPNTAKVAPSTIQRRGLQACSLCEPSTADVS
jgi:hypothetical protein